MITDDLLERGLGTIGDGYDVPPHAIDDILDQLRPAEAMATNDDDTAAAVHGWWPPSRRTWLYSAAAAVVLLVVVAFAVGGAGGPSYSVRTNGAGVAGGDSSVVTQYETSAGRTAVGSPPMTSSKVPSAPQSTSGGGSDSAVVPNDSLTKIEQTGELDLRVDKGKVYATADKLSDIASALGGLVANSQTLGGDDPSASVTVRVPTNAFGKLLSQARELGKVLSVDTKTTNVTAQYVDLKARLHALGLTKSTYLNILTKASTIGEILSVQERVNDVQTQIDQLQGQLNVLTNETTYATLTVTVDQTPKPFAAAHEQSGLSKAVHRSVSRFVHGVEAIIGVIGPIVLVLLLIGLGWLLTKVGYRVVRRQMV
jgi:hypothetical protein